MSVRQEKNKKKWTKNGCSWYFDVYYTNMYGERKEKKSKLYINRKTAKEEEIKFLNSVKTQDFTDESVLFESIYDEWANFKQSQVKASSYYCIKKRCDKHILPFFQKVKLHDIKVNLLIKWKNKIKQTKTTPEYQNIIINYLKEILEYARLNYDFDVKVASKLQKDKISIIKSNLLDQKNNFWTLDEFNQFISVVDDNFDFLTFNFLYFMGLRIGEMCALTWKDIDFKNNKVRINKTLTTKCFDCKYIITTPKTENSNRIIDMDNALSKLLKQHKKNEMKIYGFNEKWFVFGNIKYLAETTLRRKLQNYIDLSSVKKITIHGFRHSHVSLLIYLGCDRREIAERIGDTVQMVEKTYAHLFPDKKSNAVNALNKLKRIIKN